MGFICGDDRQSQVEVLDNSNIGVVSIKCSMCDTGQAVSVCYTYKHVR